MSKKLRYSLIGLGCLLFAILAPAIVLYVRGLSYDYASGHFITTGILALKTDPVSVDIYLNNKLVKQGGGDVRFLTPTQYSLRLSKPGYYDWSKLATINPGSVTWLYPAFQKIYLLKNPSIKQILSNGVLDFNVQGDRVVYVTSQNLIIGSLSNPASSQNYPLPLPVNHIEPASDGNSYALTNSSSTKPTVLLFNGQTKIFTNIRTSFICIYK
jgi:hypothetical protein